MTASSAYPSLAQRLYSVWYRHMRVYTKNLISNGFPTFVEPLLFLAGIGLGLGKYMGDQTMDGLRFIQFLGTGLLVTASMWAFQRWLSRQSGRWAFYYAVILGLMLYVHYFLFVLMLVQAAYFVLRLPSQRLIKQGIGAAALTLLISLALAILSWLLIERPCLRRKRHSSHIVGGQVR